MNCSEWEEVKIKEICSKIVSGGTPSRKNPHFFINGLHRWLKTQELKDTNIYETEEHITDEALLNSSAKICPVNTVSMAMYGATVGKLGILKKECSTNQACCNLVVNDAIADYRFLFYQLLNHRESLISLSNGAAQQNLNLRVISDYKINIPSLLEQRLISELLSCLDDKIELNNRINKNLEEMAQAIFKRWFVDFEFPDENGNPYKSSGGEMVESELGDIPKGWNIGVLKDIAVITMGQSPKGSSFNEDSKGTVFYQGRTDFGGRFPTIRLYTSEPKRMARKGDILLSVRAPVGDINVAFEDCCIGRGLASIRSMNNHSSYLLYLLSNLYDSFNVYNGEGTVFGSINKDTLNNIKIIIPSCELMQRFENLCGKIDNLILINTTENKYLTNIRDTLLPKLMSGEIRIPCEEAV